MSEEGEEDAEERGEYRTFRSRVRAHAMRHEPPGRRLNLPPTQNVRVPFPDPFHNGVDQVKLRFDQRRRNVLLEQPPWVLARDLALHLGVDEDHPDVGTRHVAVVGYLSVRLECKESADDWIELGDGKAALPCLDCKGEEGEIVSKSEASQREGMDALISSKTITDMCRFSRCLDDSLTCENLKP